MGDKKIRIALALALLATLASAAANCPAGCKCSTAQEGECKSAITCPCGTKLTGSYDCVFFKQAKAPATGADWIKTIPSAARRVDMFGCGIKTIPDGALSHLGETRVLNMEYNALTHIGAGSFKRMNKLKVLWLTGHHLQRGEDAAAHDAVEPIKNQIATIDAGAFSDNPKLAVLLMHHNKLSTIPDGTFATPAKSLRVLKLLDNAHQLDLKEDSGDVLEDWMEQTDHYLGDDNGDSSKWWTPTGWKPPQEQDGQDGDEGPEEGEDGDDEGAKDDL